MLLAFIIPLRHPAASKSWGNVVARLNETLESVSASCREGGSIGLVVANREAELPPLPEGIAVLRVDDPPPPVSVFRGECNDEERRRAVWLDKGRKIATGAIQAKKLGARYVMSVDADDLISRDIPGFVSRHAGAPGWYINKGLLLPVGSRVGLMLDDFHNWCGTYAIVRNDLLPLADSLDAIDPELIRSYLGHHRILIPALAEAGTPLQPLPFPGAIYRIGHGDGNFLRVSLTQEAFTLDHFRRNPRRFLRRLFYLRYISRYYVETFCGGNRPV